MKGILFGGLGGWLMLFFVELNFGLDTFLLRSSFNVRCPPPELLSLRDLEVIS